MSTYVLMKVLESTPERYDRGIRILSAGAIASVYAEIARRAAAPGRRLLDLGCGTGGVTLACATAGADVVGIDRDPGMLAVARAKVAAAGLGERVELIELGAMEIEDRFSTESFDAIVSCLMLSELAEEEQSYVLRTARTRLRSGGRLVVADEVRAASGGGRLWQSLRRIPQVVLTYALTQTTTRAVDDLAALVRAAGFSIDEELRIGGDFALVDARADRVVP
jgi:demethylmenaquinone methyltransferase/2-methoxy-6-polyprenyl-1,4-benzoquinol methylase